MKLRKFFKNEEIFYFYQIKKLFYKQKTKKEKKKMFAM